MFDNFVLLKQNFSALGRLSCSIFLVKKLARRCAPCRSGHLSEVVGRHLADALLSRAVVRHLSEVSYCQRGRGVLHSAIGDIVSLRNQRYLFCSIAQPGVGCPILSLSDSASVPICSLCDAFAVCTIFRVGMVLM